MGKVTFTLKKRPSKVDLKGYPCDHTRVERMSAEAADKWYKDLMIWVAENHPQRDWRKFKQQKFGVTRHWLWIMGSPYGEQNNFEKTTLCLHEYGPRQYPELGRKGLRWDGKPA